MMPMEWKSMLEKNHIAFVVDEVVEKMNIEKILETYSPLGSDSYNPKMMLKILMYGYIKKRYSSRLIAEGVKTDIYFIWLAGGNKPTRNVINDFRKDKMKIIMEDAFTELLLILESKGYIDFEDYFVDGTKIEANANKYSFVWKKSVEKNRASLQKKVHELMESIDELNKAEDIDFPEKENTPEDISEEEMEDFAKRLSEKLNAPKQQVPSEKKKEVKKALKIVTEDYLPRLKKYNRDLEKIGENRNSYSKTDHDATFMRMKEDHMKNGQLKPGYNVQVGTNNEFILNYSIHQNRNDNGTLISHLEQLKRLTGRLPNNLGADSGYGNQENYKYLKKNKIKNFVKYPLFHKEQKYNFKKQIYRVENMPYDEVNDEFTCPEGNKLKYTSTKITSTETGFQQEVRQYECLECSNCIQKEQCTKSKYNRRIDFNRSLWIEKKRVKKNLLSPKGLQMRANRAEYSERVFGQIKWNMGFKRFMLRGLDKVKIEWGLISLAFNIKKMARRIEDELKGNISSRIKSVNCLDFEV